MTAAIDSLLPTLHRLTPRNGLSLTAASTIAMLDRVGAMRLTELAAGQGVSQPAMTGLVTRLTAADLVERRADPADGRAVVVCLLPAGRAELQRRRSERAQALGTALDHLDTNDLMALRAAVPALRHLAAAAHLAHEGAR
ncbi:MAG: MarR family winged helix-turn-helix transcriptional regulator [Nocardioidaceae bacterium]